MDSLLSYVKENADLKAWLANRRLMNGVNNLRKTLTGRIEAEDFAVVNVPAELAPYMKDVGGIVEKAKAVANRYATLEQLKEELREAQTEYTQAVRERARNRKLLIIGMIAILLAVLYFIFK